MRPKSWLARRDDSVLVVIDVQDRLLRHIHGGEAVLDRTVRLVRVARTLGVPVVWTEQEKLGDTTARLAGALEGLKPVRKLSFGCFGCGPFVEALEATGRNTLVLAGIEAHICVAQTALQALHEFDVHVVADAVGSRSPVDRDTALARLRQAGAVVTTWEAVVYEWMERAGTDAFRAVLPLVK